MLFMLSLRKSELSAEIFLPPYITPSSLRIAASLCTACPLHRCGRQTVFGEGRLGSPLMIVGEQPGHEEDLEGKPFIGPAGKKLYQVLKKAGISRSQIYVTNVVKHFKWHGRGKKRIQEKPNRLEIMACLPWLKAEIALYKPKILVCLGNTAIETILGRKTTIKKLRGDFFATPWSAATYVTVHPSSLLRITNRNDRHRAYRDFVADFRKIAKRLQEEVNLLKPSVN